MNNGYIREPSPSEVFSRLGEVLAERDRFREALELIAAPQRPDGTWNRDRQACYLLAVEALENG